MLSFQIVRDLETELLRDLDLSDQSRRVGKRVVTLSESPFTLSFDGTPSYVSMRTDTGSETYWPVEIVPHGSLTQASLDGRLAVAFYNDGVSRGEISWVPESGHELTIWYDRDLEDQAIGENTELGGLYDSYLTLLAGAQIRELMNLPIGVMLSSRLTKSAEQWKKSVNMNRQQGLVNKPMCFTPRRYGRSIVDRTRFFVPR